MEETSNDDYIYINKHIDSLPMFCNWTIDVVLIFLIFVEAGIFFPDDFTGTLIIIMVGIFATWFYSKLKNSSTNGYFKQLLYRLNFTEPKTLMPSYKRKFLGA